MSQLLKLDLIYFFYNTYKYKLDTFKIYLDLHCILISRIWMIYFGLLTIHDIHAYSHILVLLCFHGISSGLYKIFRRNPLSRDCLCMDLCVLYYLDIKYIWPHQCFPELARENTLRLELLHAFSLRFVWTIIIINFQSINLRLQLVVFLIFQVFVLSVWFFLFFGISSCSFFCSFLQNTGNLLKGFKWIISVPQWPVLSSAANKSSPHCHLPDWPLT